MAIAASRISFEVLIAEHLTSSLRLRTGVVSKPARSAPPGGGTTEARAPGSKGRPASREDRAAKDDWELKNTFWVDSDGTFTRLDQRAEPLPGEIKICLDSK